MYILFKDYTLTKDFIFDIPGVQNEVLEALLAGQEAVLLLEIPKGHIHP